MILNESGRAEKRVSNSCSEMSPPPSIITSWNQYLEFFYKGNYLVN